MKNSAMTKPAKRTLSYIIAIAVFIVTIVAMILLRNNATIAEWWTMHVAKWWNSATTSVTNIVPISIFEWFIVLCAVSTVPFVIIGIGMLVKRKFRLFSNSLLAICLGVLVIANIYMATAGFQYYRAPLAMPTASVDYQKALDMTNFYIEDYNRLSATMERDDNGNVISPYTFSELSTLISKEMTRLNSTQAMPYFYNSKARAKPLVNSWLMNQLSLMGISFQPTGEAHFNALAPSSDLPFTIAHELAHQNGIMREGDANTVAEYALLTSDNEYLRYCAYFNSMHDFIWLAKALAPEDVLLEDVEKLLVPIDATIETEQNNSSLYWLNQQNSFFSQISSFFNNLYLKLNGREDGTGDYDNSGEDIGSGEFNEDGSEIYIYEPSMAEQMYYYIYYQKIAV